MSCGACGRPGEPSTTYELTTEDGEKRVYLTEVEARVARSAAGGGTIKQIS